MGEGVCFHSRDNRDIRGCVGRHQKINLKFHSIVGVGVENAHGTWS